MKYRDHGYIVTAVDIRDNRVPDPEDMTNITFVKQNVEDAVLDDYDVISNLGLFYHMTLAQQIAMMTRTPQNSITIMETQIFEPHTQTAKGRERLTPAKDGDYWGARYTEPGNHVSTAAWDSSESFWHNPNSLLRLFRKTGFKMVMPVNPKFMSMFASRGYYILFK